MSQEKAPEPEQIYERTREEGLRRLSRPPLEVAATAVAAGLDVVFGIAAFGFAEAAVEPRFGKELAHLAGAIAFGVAFVFIIVGRSELFTENFLVPLAGLDRGDRRSWVKLAELWLLSPVFNILGGILLVLVLTTHGVLPHGTGHAITSAGNVFDDYTFVSAFMSAIAAGALITLMTWMIEGHHTMGVRITVAWIVGAVLALGQFNHVIVATLDEFFGIRLGSSIGWLDFFQNLLTAALGNMIGGVLFVTLTRFTQARSSG